MTKNLGKYSFGTGDRFGKEGEAQLRAVIQILEAGVQVTPVWNKSHREHQTVQSKPRSIRTEADNAVKNLGYREDYFVDADHINLNTVDAYIDFSDFFTIDVADYIGEEANKEDKDEFLNYFEKYTEKLIIPGISEEIIFTSEDLDKIINTFLFATKKASEVYKHISAKKKTDFIVEVSMDEVAIPQSPKDLFLVLAALSFYDVPINTIAPKFTGQFNKGIDYKGNLEQFTTEFEEDILVIKFAVQEFKMPKNLKLSIHSGSDKFSLYPVMRKITNKHQAGLHVKTAGTTWLEEITTIAESGETGFDFALFIYQQALERFQELTSPYPDVLEINTKKLPLVEELKKKGSKEMAKALRHDKSCKNFNPHLRQLIHCAYKIAAENNKTFSFLLDKHRVEIEKNVTFNLYEKHLKPLFIG